MNTRKLKPIRELQTLSPELQDQLWLSLQGGLSFSRAVRRLGAEHFIAIKRHKIVRWFHLESERRQMNRHLPQEFQITLENFIDLQNGAALPWPALMHQLILRAATLLTFRDDNTPAQLVALQRIANNPLKSEIAREKLDLERRRQSLREQQFQFRQAASEQKTESDKSKATTDKPAKPEPFRMWTAEEVRTNQPKIEAAFQAHPFLRYIGLPPSDEPVHDEYSARAEASIKAAFKPVEPAPTPAPEPPKTLLERVDEYNLARHKEIKAGKDRRYVSRNAAWNFKSKMKWCPCGEDLPCPNHGDFPALFWEWEPTCADYGWCLERRNLPFTPVRELIRAEEERAQAAAEAAAAAAQPSLEP